MNRDNQELKRPDEGSRLDGCGGVDLNHRPLGYEFDSWFGLIHADLIIQ